VSAPPAAALSRKIATAANIPKRRSIIVPKIPVATIVMNSDP
jgi:hypothetical protein